MQGKLTPASDVYALGVLIWEMCKQQRAWASASWPAIRAAVLNRKLQKFQNLPPDIQVPALLLDAPAAMSAGRRQCVMSPDSIYMLWPCISRFQAGLSAAI